MEGRDLRPEGEGGCHCHRKEAHASQTTEECAGRGLSLPFVPRDRVRNSSSEMPPITQDLTLSIKILLHKQPSGSLKTGACTQICIWQRPKARKGHSLQSTRKVIGSISHSGSVGWTIKKRPLTPRRDVCLRSEPQPRVLQGSSRIISSQ